MDYESPAYNYPPLPGVETASARFGEEWAAKWQAVGSSRIRSLAWWITDAMERGMYPNPEIAARRIIDGGNYGKKGQSYGTVGYDTLISAIMDAGLWPYLPRVTEVLDRA